MTPELYLLFEETRKIAPVWRVRLTFDLIADTWTATIIAVAGPNGEGTAKTEGEALRLAIADWVREREFIEDFNREIEARIAARLLEPEKKVENVKALDPMELFK